VLTLTRSSSAPALSFEGRAPGQERIIEGVRLRWCPAGRFLMGSPRDEPERRARTRSM
jgi:hypothetical protein